MKKLGLALLVVLAAATPCRGAKLALLVANDADAGQAQAPVTSGIPWPQGALKSAAALRLLDPDGNEQPLQVEVLGLWPDESIKWTLLDFQATVKRKGTATYGLEHGEDVRRGDFADRALSLQEDPTQIAVSSGAATFKVSKKSFTLFDEVTLKDQERPLVAPHDEADGLSIEPSEEMASLSWAGKDATIQLPGPDRIFLGRHRLGPEWFRGRGFRVLDAATGEDLGVEIRDASLDAAGKQSVLGHGWCEGVFLRLDRAPGRAAKVVYPRAAAKPRAYHSSLGPAQVAIETKGPVRSVVRVAGKFQATDGATLCDYVARLHFFAGKPAARLELTVLNREKLPLSQGLETYPLLVNDLSVRLPLRLSGLLRLAFCGESGRGATHRSSLRFPTDRAELVQFAGRALRLSRYAVTQRNEELASGAAAGGAAALWDPTRGAAIVVRRMAPSNPKSLRVLGRPRLEAGLFPREAGPCEEFLAGRARTHDILFWFYSGEPPPLPDLSAAFDGPLSACALLPDEPKPTGRWYAASGVLDLAPLAPHDYDLRFPADLQLFLDSREASGAYGMWNYGAQGTARCRVVELTVDRASPAEVHSPALVGLQALEGLALLATSGGAANATRVDPPIVAGSNPKEGFISFAKALRPSPESGARAILYEPHGAFLCHRFDPAVALAREHLRRGDARLLDAAHVAARHLADVGTFHNVEGGDERWTGACHDPSLGPTAHHVPGLGPEASWYAGAWLTYLLTGDRAILDAALENATFVARHADDRDLSPFALSLGLINLCYATDAAPVASPDLAPVFQAALDTYLKRLLDAQRLGGHGLYGDRGALAGLALEALAACQRRRPDDRIPPSMRQAAEALTRPSAFWSGHERTGGFRVADGAKPSATPDGLVEDWARHPEAPTYGPPCALVLPFLAAIGEAAGDTTFIKKARRLERVADLFPCDAPSTFALRYRRGDLFAAPWERYLKAHPTATDEAIGLQCRLENAADVALPDIGLGGCVLFRPFVPLPDGSRAYQAQAPGIPDHPGTGLWFPFLDSPNMAESQGAVEFRVCYRKGPGSRESTWVASGDPRESGFALTLTANGLQLAGRETGGTAIDTLARDAKVQSGKWHHVAFTWRRGAGVELFFDGRKVGQKAGGRVGFDRRLRFPCDPADQVTEYLIDDLRIWKRIPDPFRAATDTVPPAAVTDLILAPAEDGTWRLTWTAPAPAGGAPLKPPTSANAERERSAARRAARRYDIRISSLPFRGLSWGAYPNSAEPLPAIHWAEADRIVPAPKPQPAGQLETLTIGSPLRRATVGSSDRARRAPALLVQPAVAQSDRRFYVALKTEDEAGNVSPLSNVVSTDVNHPPVANAGPPVRQAITGSEVFFDARDSSDPDYDELTYEWSNGLKAPTGTVRYDKPGTYDVALTVSDGKATAAATTRLIVSDTVKVNFQPRRAPKTPEGFMADDGQVYTRTRGYGWRAIPPGMKAFARIEPAGLPLEAMTGLHFPTRAEWLLDVPNGAYKLTLAAGDPANLTGRRRIFVEGKEAAAIEFAGQTTPHVLTDHKVTVADGQLNLHLGIPPELGQPSPDGGEINYLILQRIE